MIVVDTNVIAYLLIKGDQTETAEQVRKSDSEWAAPILWRSEMGNLLMLYIRQKIASLDDAKTIMDKAEDILSGREYEVESSRVLELAATTGCTAYDCEFAYLAEKLNAPLVTSDKKLLAAFPDTAVSMETFTT